MRAQCISELYERKLSKSIAAVRCHDATVRVAAQQYCVAKSTLQDRCRAISHPRASRRHTTITEMEEDTVVRTLLQCFHRGVPLTRRNLIEALQCIGRTFTLKRSSAILFGMENQAWILFVRLKNGTPSSCIYAIRPGKNPRAWVQIMQIRLPRISLHCITSFAWIISTLFESGV